MTVMAAAWIVLGAAAGATHSAALWRAAGHVRAMPLATLWRWPVVVGVLVAAALAGRLLPAAGGWAGAFAGTSTMLYFRSGR